MSVNLSRNGQATLSSSLLRSMTIPGLQHMSEVCLSGGRGAEPFGAATLCVQGRSGAAAAAPSGLFLKTDEAWEKPGRANSRS